MYILIFPLKNVQIGRYKVIQIQSYSHNLYRISRPSPSYQRERVTLAQANVPFPSVRPWTWGLNIGNKSNVLDN